MSGELYEVLGEGRFVPGEVCPEQLRGAKVRLKPMDGDALQVDAEVACVAARVRQALLQHGVAAEVPLPVKRATLSKVLEYMRYHSQVPPGDIRTPLVSEDLAECGTTRWDAGFISVDRGLLVELLYASAALGVPTLGLLARAKASAMLFGRSPDQIRKEFGFSNDLPPSEEAELQAAVRALRQRRNLPPEEEGALALATAVLNSVWRTAAAEGETGAEAETRRGQVDLRSWRQGSWRAAVVEDWRQLAHAPPEVRADRSLLLGAIRHSRGAALQFASPELAADREVVLASVSAGGESLAFAAPALRSDRAFVLEALALDAAALAGASVELQGDRELVLAAAEAGGGAALGSASPSLRGDAEFVLECAQRDVRSLRHASAGLLADRAFVLRAVSTVQGALPFVPPKLRADAEVVQAAAAFDTDAWLSAHPARQQDAWRAAAASAHPPVLRAAPVSPMHPAAVGNDGSRTLKMQKSIVFTALSTITPNMGQANYIASNSYLDKLPPYQRPEVEAVGLMWGTVGGMGMRWKAFGDRDFMNATPDLLMGVDDASKVLHVVATKLDMPEWVGANFMDPQTRAAILAHSSAFGGYRPSEEATAYPSVPLPRPPPPPSREPRRQGAASPRGPEPELRCGQAPPAGDPRAGAPGQPLGGWPALAGVEGAAERPRPSAGPQQLAEGVRVELVGLRSKSGLTGTVVKCYEEGRYRVALDGAKGSALLKPEYLQVIAVPSVVQG